MSNVLDANELIWADHAIWIGRYQPFHLGHVRILRRSLSLLGMRHIIGLVSYEQNSSILESEAKHVRARNPFTPRERYVLAYLSLAAEGVIGDVDIIYVPYLEPSKWDRVDTYLPVASIFCTTNKDSADIERDSIFRRMGRRSILLDVSGLDIVNSSAIKDAILGGQPWQQYLHPAVHTYFESIDGPRRLAEAAS